MKTVCAVINENELRNKNAIQLIKESGAFGNGEERINFAPIERHSALLRHVTSEIIDLIWENGDHSDLLQQVQGWCGMPVTGQSLACALAQQAGDAGETFALEYIFPRALMRNGITSFIFSRHKPKKGENWLIVEDVLLNFKLVGDVRLLVEGYGAHAVGVVCFCNSTGQSSWSPTEEITLPIISLMTCAEDGTTFPTSEPELGTKSTRTYRVVQ